MLVIVNLDCQLDWSEKCLGGCRRSFPETIRPNEWFNQLMNSKSEQSIGKW
jgi:hypothetical protein